MLSTYPISSVLAQELPPLDEDLGDQIDLPSEEAFDAIPEEAVEPQVDEATDSVSDQEKDSNDSEASSESTASEEELFGTEEGTATEEGVPTHTVRLEFNSNVSFTNPDEPSPYLEIVYSTVMETPIELNRQTHNYEVSATVDVQTTGSLAQNEFFECRLDIAFQETNVKLTAKLNSEGSVLNDTGEENASTYQAVFRTAFSETMAEDWFSYCTDVSGATLNTIGAPENYDLQILKLIEPDLKALVLDNFDLTQESRIPLSVPMQVVDDNELNNKVTLSGEGVFVISPITPQ